MASFAGIVDFSVDSRKQQQQWVAAMLAAMKHRSPDGTSIWSSDSACLGQGLFRTSLDRPAETGPVSEGQLSLVGDVRLDNRAELAAELGRISDSLSDERLILAAYRRWGSECANHLLGDFSFALLDVRDRSLLLVRDHFGVKPFYYSQQDCRIAFASEFSALFVLPGISRDIDEECVADYVAGFADDPDRTFFLQIRRLPARHRLVFAGDGQRLEPYWSPSPARADPKVPYHVAFRTLFARAVASRLTGALSPGILLSGGLDSSSIAVVAAQLKRDAGDAVPLPTISMIFDETPAGNERQHIEAVVSQGGFEPIFVQRDHFAPFHAVMEILHEQHQPFLAPGHSVSRIVYAEAARRGIRTLLDGHGGDEAVSHGFGRVGELARDGRWLQLWRGLQATNALYRTPGVRVFAATAISHGRGPWWRAARQAIRVLRGLRALSHGGLNPTISLLNVDLLGRTGLATRQRERRKREHAEQANERLSHESTVLSPFVAYAFEVLDKAAAASGVEARYPFYDKRLVEFCLGLPSDQKLGDGWTRLVLRRAMQGLLPPSVQWRRDKFDFGPVLCRQMLKMHSDLLDEIILQDKAGVSAYFELKAIQAAYQRLVVHGDKAAGADGQLVWRAVVLGLWLREARGGSVAAPKAEAVARQSNLEDGALICEVTK
jgi:asparagine synthase (glutamine-hydrolysing)